MRGRYHFTTSLRAHLSYKNVSSGAVAMWASSVLASTGYNFCLSTGPLDCQNWKNFRSGAVGMWTPKFLAPTGYNLCISCGPRAHAPTKPRNTLVAALWRCGQCMPNDNRHDVHCDRAHCEMESGSILGTRIEMFYKIRRLQAAHDPRTHMRRRFLLISNNTTHSLSDRITP